MHFQIVEKCCVALAATLGSKCNVAVAEIKMTICYTAKLLHLQTVWALRLLNYSLHEVCIVIHVALVSIVTLNWFPFGFRACGRLVSIFNGIIPCVIQPTLVPSGNGQCLHSHSVVGISVLFLVSIRVLSFVYYCLMTINGL